jgi:ribosomal protein S18 acetylase RimI-like enzyme
MIAMVEVSVARQPSEDLLAALRRLVPQLSTTAAPLEREALAAILRSPATSVLIARDGGEIVGMLTLVMYRLATGLRARIEDVVVDSGARGRGVGEALSREALRLAAEAGARSVDLTSNPDRAAANQLYLRIGFKLRNTNAYRYRLD